MPIRPTSSAIPSPVAWMLAWLIGTVTGAAVLVAIFVIFRLARAIEKDGLASIFDSLGFVLRDAPGTFGAGMFAGGIFALIWALLGAGLCRLSGRFSMWAIVSLGAAVPPLVLLAIGDESFTAKVLGGLLLVASIGAISAFVGICLGRGIDAAKNEQETK